MVANIVERPYRITQNDPSITADSSFGVTWRDTWSLQVPENMSILLKAGDTIAMKLYDSGDAEYACPAAMIKIEARDSSGRNIRNIFGPAMYARLKEFADRTKKAVLTLDQPVLLEPNDFLVFMTKDDTGMDSASIANSFMEFMTSRLPAGASGGTKLRALPTVEPFEVTQEDSAVTQADTSASVWGDLFDYKVPKGRSVILRPGDQFSLYLVDTDTSEVADTARIKLVRRDSTGGEERPIIPETLYASVKEFQDKDSMYTLAITRAVEVLQDEHIVLMCYDDVGGDKDLSYFSLVCRTRRL